MKTLRILIAMALLAPIAEARIGETEQQIEARYGKPTMVLSTDQFAATKRYSFNGYDVTVSFEKGASACELYQKIDGSKIEPVERYDLIAKNFNGLQCDPLRSDNPAKLLFTSPDGRQRVAVCDLIANTILVATKDFLERASAHQDEIDAKKVSGF